MRPHRSTGFLLAALLLQWLFIATAHGHDNIASPHSDPANLLDTTKPYTGIKMDNTSYFALGEHTGSMLGHIAFMAIAWFFVLPVGVVLSIARSRFTLTAQITFTIFNGIGVLFSVIFNTRTPDLYDNNAHHKVGWIATWVFAAQVLMSVLFHFSGHNESRSAVIPEQPAYKPLSLEELAGHQQRQDQSMQDMHVYQWHRDSGQGTERASSSLDSLCASPTEEQQGEESERLMKSEADDAAEADDSSELTFRRRFFRSIAFERLLRNRMPRLLSRRTLEILGNLYDAIDRLILILGFIAISTGAVTYGGIMRGDAVLNGLAHFIKGGIFFWYGLLTLGRWMGCFADLGWAWNVKPSRAEVGRWKSRIPSGEFVESFVIFLYGCTNVFLEHLAAWGDAWTPQDLEHVSISIMFFGGGLAGMLVESKKVRALLNTSINTLPIRPDMDAETAQTFRPPKTYSVSMNPMPALIILLLGMMMSSHHQDSMVSTMVHKQWGILLVGFSFARAVTYILLFISPPTSLLPARPPSELISAFCLISGGLIFMASNKDIVHAMDVYDLNAMFVFTVTMGFTAFLMAWETIVLAIKGWATRKEINRPQSSFALSGPA